MDLYCTNCVVKLYLLVGAQFCSLQPNPMCVCMCVSVYVCVRMSVHHSQSCQLLSAILNQFDGTHTIHASIHTHAQVHTHALIT